MRRKCTDTLILWKKNPARRPLVLQGGRQTGKTWLLRDFGSRQYETTVYINLETERTAAEYLSVPRTAEDALLFMETYAKKPIRQSSTLVILDNIQCVPLIPRLLSTIALDFPGYHITAIERGISGTYDTHDLEFLRLYPLDFEEFLWANTEYNLAKEIRAHFARRTPMGKQLHEKAMTQFHLYLIIGGMPEAILEYRKEKKLLMVPDVQQKILTLLQADITAQAPAGLSRHCLNCWQTIPSQLGRANSKFQYRQITKSGTSRLYEEPLKWLIDAGFVYSSFRYLESSETKDNDGIKHPDDIESKTNNDTKYLNQLELKDHDFFEHLDKQKTRYDNGSKYGDNFGAKDNNTFMRLHNFATKDGRSFHLYFTDIGLSTCYLGMPSYLLLTGEDTPGTRSCIETYLAQIFAQNGYTLSYWSSGNQAEVPFLLEKSGHFTAIDYRLTPHQKNRNLTRLNTLHPTETMYLLSPEDFKTRDTYDIIPLYAAFCI